MISPPEECFITDHAYVPEHLPGYVCAISGAEPHLLGEDYLCFRMEDTLLFNGYPLRGSFAESALGRAIDTAVSRFKPRQVALIAPKIPEGVAAGQPRERDQCYRLDLLRVPRDGKLRNTLRRASRDTRVESTHDIREEHRALIAEFLETRPVSQQIRHIFERIPAYVASVPTALVFGLRDRAEALVAFDVAEFGAKEYAFYQFNFRSRKPYVPGASDLLLDAMIGAARSGGKRFLNLGLGIHPGVQRFKEKWGGAPFLSYEYCRFASAPPNLFDLILRRL